MQAFFSSLDELENFTHNLNTLSRRTVCPHCDQHDQWISHGYVYKQRTIDDRQIVGKRVVCARRFGKCGCGRTRQLYLDNHLPRRHKPLSVMLAFIAQLIQGASVQQAYYRAVGQQDSSEPRQAWRWLKALYQRISYFRQGTTPSEESSSPNLSHRSHRLRVLLPTLHRFWNQGDLSYRLQQSHL